MLMTRGVGAAFEPAGDQLVARVEQSRVCASLWVVWAAVWASLSLLCASLSLLQSRVCASLSVARASLSVIWAWSSVGASQMSP